MHGHRDDDVNRRDTYNTTSTRTQATDVASAIANYCGRAEQNGLEWKCCCPICGRHSFSIKYGDKIPLLFRCWHCEACGINDGWTEQKAHLIEAGLLEPDSRSIKKMSREEYAAYCEAKRERARDFWDALWAIKPEYKAGKYLTARGLGSFIGHPALRCSGPMWIREARTFRPTLASRVWHVQFGLCAVQLTYLNYENNDRDRELGRKTVGVLKGGAVWIGKPKPDEEFVVAEGLESCLSAMLILNLRCGAAVLGPNLKSLELPASARKLHIAADNDPTGIPAADAAAQTWRARGLCVRVSVPDKDGEDFNDVLRRNRG